MLLLLAVLSLKALQSCDSHSVLFRGLYILWSPRECCAERLQVWNQPRKRNIEPRPIKDVVFQKRNMGYKSDSKYIT